jgi:hypothetical protein
MIDRGFGALIVLLSAGSAQAAAPVEQSAGVQVFPAQYFAPSHPADAYDMVSKLPGFELIEGDEDVRGFTGSRGNVLFDGRSPSGKSETLEQMLRRIPASSVLRIELIRGGANSTATGGYDLVANVVRRSIAGGSSAIAGGASAAHRVGVKPNARLELSRHVGGGALDAAAALETDIDDDSGHGAIVERTPEGAIVEREDRDEREYTRTMSLDGQYKVAIGPGELVANGSVKRDRTAQDIRSRDADVASLATDRERLWSGEAGAQYHAQAAGGEIEALVSQRIGRLNARAEEEDEAFSEATRTSESIARFEYRRGSERLRLFGSLEGALNSLTSDASLVVVGTPVPIIGSDVAVRERRAEAALGATWTASPALVVEPSMRVETSTIRSSGDSPSKERFLFWKPRLRVSWEHGQTRVQSTFEREAAQLDFGDFVASAELDRNDVTAGATALRPPTTWSFSTTFEQRFWGSGALLLTYRREWIRDVLDEVLVEDDGELFDAVGNIGKGERRIVKAELTAPLDRLGIAGMQLKSVFTFIKSRVTDPVTGRRRIIAEDRPFEGDLRLTHDLPGGRWSWGADASLPHHERKFRFDQERLERKGVMIGAHVEFRPSRDWRIRLEGVNIASRSLVETRRSFAGTRASGIVDSIETRRLRTSPIVIVSIRKSFGAAAN